MGKNWNQLSYNQSKQKMIPDDSDSLLGLYLWLNQAAYAIVAFPIGTVLSIAPIFFNTQKNVTIETIGCTMAVGELLGVVAMKIAIV